MYNVLATRLFEREAWFKKIVFEGLLLVCNIHKSRIYTNRNT